MTPSLHRITISPRSPWRTPWQADTLTGALLATCARTHGATTLRQKLIDPMLAGRPPFVLSDALPGDLLPLPIHFRLHRYPEGTNLKAVKRARWLAPDAFCLARTGTAPAVDAFIADQSVFRQSARHHNTLSRLTDTSSREEGDETSAIGLFQKSDTLLLNADNRRHLTLYFRFADPSAGDLLVDLLHELSLTGFGADVSIGRGQFDLPDDPTPVPELDSPPAGANAVVSLSTFQPGPSDPTDGYWDAFPKFGKLAPDHAVDDVRKNTLIMFRPGAVFRTDPATPFLGRTIDTEQLFPADVARDLLQRDLRIVHPAFSVTIPIQIEEPT
jgi:CRISPR/Cas system CSM-associated protein Csm4 (group 5 of RAMP superfamily)